MRGYKKIIENKNINSDSKKIVILSRKKYLLILFILRYKIGITFLPRIYLRYMLRIYRDNNVIKPKLYQNLLYKLNP